ncbi:MAG: hypothetical protein QM737_15365 [Ferruginibacter sp.]
MILENSPKIEELFRLYLNDQCTPEQVQSLLLYFKLDKNEAILKQIIAAELEKPDDSSTLSNKKVKAATDRVFKEIQKKKKK